VNTVKSNINAACTSIFVSRQNKTKISNLIQIFFGFIFISLLSACSGNNDKTTVSSSVTKIPAPLQKLIVTNGALSAFIVIDGVDTNRIPMIIDATGEGSATVIIPRLSRTQHEIIITYLFTDAAGDMILATSDIIIVDLSSGSANLNLSADIYDLDSHDDDGDGISNASELLLGTNPRIVENNGGIALQSLDVRVTGLPDIGQNAVGVIRAFIVVDNDDLNPIIMEINDTDIKEALLTISNLTQTLHNIKVVFEYVENNRVFILSTIVENADLAFNTELNLNINEFDFASYDEDGDGVNNSNELLGGTDPFLASAPGFAATMTLTLEATKTFSFSWADVTDATYYQVLENKDGVSGFEQVGVDIPQGQQTFDHVVALFARANAQYQLQSCNLAGCVIGSTVFVTGPLIESIGYFKASESIISANGLYLAVGGFSISAGAGADAGIVYVFSQSNGNWEQQAILRASNADPRDRFGQLAIDFNSDGSVLAIGATGESGDALSVIASDNNQALNAGAVYVFIRTDNNWTQQAYIKASNVEAGDKFGSAVSLDATGTLLAVGATGESSDAVGVNNNLDISLDSNLSNGSGAVYTFTQTNDLWNQQSYIKASNTGVSDRFGRVVSLSADGRSLAVGAADEDSSGVGVNSGLQLDGAASGSGAVYTFVFNTDIWVQEAYIKASDTTRAANFGWDIDLIDNGLMLVVGSRGDNSAYIFERTNEWLETAKVVAVTPPGSGLFGHTVSLSADGSILAVGDISKNGASVGINGVPQDGNANSGAAYIFTRDTNWSQTAFIKASNSDINDGFGNVSLSGDGSVLAVGASGEDGGAVGINGDQLLENGNDSGAVYLY